MLFTDGSRTEGVSAACVCLETDLVFADTPNPVASIFMAECVALGLAIRVFQEMMNRDC